MSRHADHAGDVAGHLEGEAAAHLGRAQREHDELSRRTASPHVAQATALAQVEALVGLGLAVLAVSARLGERH